MIIYTCKAVLIYGERFNDVSVYIFQIKHIMQDTTNIWTYKNVAFRMSKTNRCLTIYMCYN